MVQETVSKRKANKDFFPVLTVLLYLLTAVGSVSAYYMADTRSKDIFYILITAFVLTTFFIFFLVLQCNNQINSVAECYLMAACYGCGYLVLFLSVRYSTLFFLAIGPLLASMLFSFPIGFMLQVILSILFCLLCGYAPEQALVLFLTGSILCMVSRFFKKKNTYWYGMVVAVSSYITLMVLMNRFVLHKSMGNGVIYSVLCCIVTVGICNTLYTSLRGYIKNTDKDSVIQSGQDPLKGNQRVVEWNQPEASFAVESGTISSNTNRLETGKVAWVTEPITPVMQQVKPITQPIKSTTQPIKSTTQPIKSITQPIKSITQPMKSIAQQVKAVEAKKIAEVKKLQDSKVSVEQALDVVFPQQEEKQETSSFAIESKLNDVRFQLIKVLFPENILMEQLRDRSPHLFLHSQKIGNISYDAAKTIGANSLLAKAGGYYHEIGRLNEGNYINEGIRLAEEQHFPDSVIQIIRQHNVKISNPTSPEAAIVMLTDSIVSTAEYVNHAPENKRVTIDKIIQNIFVVRMKNGTLDDAGITPDQLQILTKFYLGYFEHSTSETNQKPLAIENKNE